MAAGRGSLSGKSGRKAGSLAGIMGLVMLLGVGTARAQRPLGTDVSGYQPSINWTTVKYAGVAFAWAKATEGTGYINPDFTSQESGARGVGVLIGAYHFARPSSHPNITGINSADSEASYFWATAGPYVANGGGYLVPMLDWEDTGATVAAGFTTSQMSAWVNEWCIAVSNYARASGVIIKPVVYTGTWYSVPSPTYPGVDSSVTGWPVWIAAYPSNPSPQTGGPSSSSPWPTWNIWQYADTNWSGGDADVYKGTLAGFQQTFEVGGTNVPSITANPASLTVVPGSNVTFSVTATGQAPFGYYWYFDGTYIAGATSSNYTVANVQLGNAGGYQVVVSNSYATVPSTMAFLSVIAPLTNGNSAAVAPTGLVDWWPGEGNAHDIFGSFNGTPHNGFSYVSGEEGLAFHFDGSTSYVTTGAPTLAAPWTACMWVNRQNAPGTAAALMSDGIYSLKLEQYNGTRQVGVTQLAVGDYAFNYTAPIGTWTHLAFVNNGSQTLLYANGVLQGGTNAIPLPRAYLGFTYVASNGSLVDYLLGGVDEIMCFNRALSAGEINAIYTAGSTGLVRAPAFSGLQPVSASQLQLGLEGITGKTISIYRSLDLGAWMLLSTISNPSGAVQFTDNNATNGIGFYRLSQP